MKFCFWGNISKGFEGKPMGGGEKQQYLIALYLSKLGHEVVIIDFLCEEDYSTDGVTILSLKKEKKQNRVNTYRAFYSLLKKSEPDVYYARIRSSIHLLALYISKRKKKKFIYHSAHDLDASYFKDRWKGFYLQTPSYIKRFIHIIHSEFLFPIILKFSDLIICQNNFQFNTYLKKKHKSKKLLIVNNLFVFDDDNGIEKDKREDKNDFITVSSLDLRKGINDLLSLIKENPEKSFVVIGKARDSNGKAFVESIKKIDNCKYFGFLPQKEVLSYIAESKYLLSTSKGEGFPNVFLESWSVGTPVISLNIDPSDVIVKHNLGKYYNNNFDDLSLDIKKIKLDKTPNHYVSYVKNNHDPIIEMNKLINSIEKL